MLRIFGFTDTTNFNPRPHEGSDLDNWLANSLCHISIHAPTRGAT